MHITPLSNTSFLIIKHRGKVQVSTCHEGFSGKGVCRGIALLSHSLSPGMVWVVSATPLPLYHPQERQLVPKGTTSSVPLV